jgi:putative lipoic acid-binding regulatory protein
VRETNVAKRDAQEQDIRQALISLPGVQSCKIEFDEDRTISAIHVVSTSTRPAKQLVRDIESLLQADFGIGVDHRKISIARITGKPEVPRPRAPRPRLNSITFSASGGKGECKVVLARDDFEACGECSGVVVGGGGLRLVAKATFRAVEMLTGKEIEFELLDVVRMRIANRETVIVLANYVSEGNVMSLAGCVQFDDSEQQATVHAALDACNRVVEVLPVVEHTEYEINPFSGA